MGAPRATIDNRPLSGDEASEKPYVLVISMHADPAMTPGFGEWGGTHVYMHELLDSFEQTDVECVMVTRRCMEELPAVERHSKTCVIHRLTNGEHAPMKKTLLRNYHNENVEAISHIIEERGHAPLAIHGVYWNSGRIAIELCLKYGSRMVYSVISNSRRRLRQGADLDDPERGRFEQEIYEAADVILCVSQDEKDDVCHLYHIDEKKVWVAGQYIHPSYLAPAHSENNFPRLNSDLSREEAIEASRAYNMVPEQKIDNLFWTRKVFSYYGRVCENKGVDHVVAAWFRLRKAYGKLCPPLWIVGGSLLEIDRMRDLVKLRGFDLEQEENEFGIVWWGCLDPPGVSAVLGKSLALVTNSLYEPGGRMVVEAMCAAVPVVASPFGLAKDLVRDWRNGFLVDHGDEGGLARRMEHFVRQPFLSSALGHNAKRDGLRVVSEWSFFDSHLEAYGIPVSKKPCGQPESDDWYKMRKAAIYPVSYDSVSASPLVRRAQQEGSKYRRPPRSSSDVFISDEERIVVKQHYQRFTLAPLFNPVARHRLTRSRSRAFAGEVVGHRAFRQSVIVEVDADNCVMVTELLDRYPLGSPAALVAASRELLAATPDCPVDDAVDFAEAVESSPVASCSDIEALLARLEKRFAPYEFASSGMFATPVSWAIAPILVQANGHLLSVETVQALELAVGLFSGSSHSVKDPHIIALDVREEHVRRHDGKLALVDLARCSIGETECEIADLLFSYATNKGVLFDLDFWVDVVPQVATGLSVGILASAIAYRVFYNAVLKLVMRPETGADFPPGDMRALFVALRNME